MRRRKKLSPKLIFAESVTETILIQVIKELHKINEMQKQLQEVFYKKGVLEIWASSLQL